MRLMLMTTIEFLTDGGAVQSAVAQSGTSRAISVDHKPAAAVDDVTMHTGVNLLSPWVPVTVILLLVREVLMVSGRTHMEFAYGRLMGRVPLKHFCHTLIIVRHIIGGQRETRYHI